MLNGEDLALNPVRVTRSILERGINDPIFMIVMAANATTPDDIEFTVKEILEYLEKTKKEAEG